MSLQYLSFLRNDSNNLSKQVTFYNFGNRSSHGNDCFWFLELFSIKYQAQSVHSYIISTPPGTFLVIGEIQEIPYSVRMRTSLTITLREYCTGSIFIVIGISFSAIFFTSTQIGAPRVLSEENLPSPLTYILSIISYCFIFVISFPWKSSGEHPPRAPFDLILMLWLVEKFVFVPPKISSC